MGNNEEPDGDPIQLHWKRECGIWRLGNFFIDSFKELSDQPLSQALVDLRAIEGGDWTKDSVEELIDVRNSYTNSVHLDQ